MSALYSDANLWNRHSIFKDRSEAGRALAEFLAPDYEGQAMTFVLAIPAGGVPVGIELSKQLQLPFDCLIVRKLQIPGNTEAGFGAMASGGQVLLNQELVRRIGLSQNQIDTQTKKVQEELAIREDLFRRNRPFPNIEGMEVILTDDGLTSGYTMLAAIRFVLAIGAKKVVVAVPTAPLRSIRQVEQEANAVYSLHVQESGAFAVANAYQHWYDLGREEVAGLLETFFQDFDTSNDQI